jgi:fibronectin type 3 domain-containing protein
MHTTICPTGVAAVSTPLTSITVSWTVSTGATSYHIYRSTSASGPFTTLAGTSATSPFTDTGLLSGKQYYYELTASNAGGASVLSTPPVTATTT